MARTPFKLKSGNTPTSRSRVEKFVRGLFGGISTASRKIEKGTQKFGSDVEKTVRQVAKTVNPDRKGKKYTRAKRKAGESQYQANVRARKEARKSSPAKGYLAGIDSVAKRHNKKHKDGTYTPDHK